MKRLVLLGMMLLLGAVLAACATLSEDQCLAGDWAAIGFDDGSQGRPPGYVSNHAQACSEYGIAVDQALYNDGRNDGLRSYCRLSNAAREGRSGEPYFGVCDGALGLAFSRVHAAGEEIYEAEAEINSLDSEIDRSIRALGVEGLTPEQLAEIRRELTSLQFQRSSLQRRLRMLEQQLDLTQRNEEFRLAQMDIAA